MEMTREELNIFYQRYRVRLFNVSYRILCDRMDAEEVMQDVMIKYLKSGMSLELPKEEAWLVKSVVRGAIDRLRKRKREELFLQEYRSDAEDLKVEELDRQMWGALSQSDSDLVSRVRKGVESLPDGYRTILLLLLFEGYDYQEVAEILDVTESTVRSQYMRGRKRLLEILKEMPGQTLV
ncbi:MAG: RNA polymerase sigma factor [Bacteroidales bacterium]|nr:RNA polymerase sigma factor [Bacteroidales bacterium]